MELRCSPREPAVKAVHRAVDASSARHDAPMVWSRATTIDAIYLELDMLLPLLPCKRGRGRSAWCRSSCTRFHLERIAISRHVAKSTW